MKKIIILFSLIFISLHLVAQDQYKTFLNERETKDILNEVKNYGAVNPKEREGLNGVFEKINENTIVVGIQSFRIKNFDLFNSKNNPANNLKFNKSIFLLINKEKDSVDNFGIYNISGDTPFLFYNSLDYSDKEFDESMFSILNFMEKSDWEKEKISIISVSGTPGFFVLYKGLLYVPYRNRMIEFVEYFDQIESFYYRFCDLLGNKKFYQEWNDSDEDR